MNQLRNWSFRVVASLVIAFNVLVVLSISIPAYGGLTYTNNECPSTPVACKTTYSCSRACKPRCYASCSVRNCRCQCVPGYRTCICRSTLPG
jgi:hypothetical protein